MICPACREEMAEETYRNVPLDVCQSCPGVWFDWGELEAYHEAEGGLTIQGIPGPRATFEPTGDSARVLCPRCEGDLLRTGKIGRHKVIRCTTCGGVYVSLSGTTNDNNGPLDTAVRAFKDIVGALFGGSDSPDRAPEASTTDRPWDS